MVKFFTWFGMISIMNDDQSVNSQGELSLPTLHAPSTCSTCDFYAATT